MDPSKLIGKIKKQVQMEHETRRNFPKLWAPIIDPEKNKFYHQDEIDKQLKEKLKLQDLCPYEYTGKGDSYFVSPQMYKALLGTCRCGRPRRGLHMDKCLQRAIDPLPTDGQSMNQIKSIPPTSNSYIGFVQSSENYRKLERSMQYVSPMYSLPGPRVTAVPYNAILIG